MERLDPPGMTADLDDEGRKVWSDKISGWLDQAKAGDPAQNDGPRPQFFNPLKDPPVGEKRVATISWNAFPRQVRISSLSDKQRWRRADSSRDLQDEYCEWSVERDSASGKIRRVMLTCEGPEYWEFLANRDPQKVVALYQEFISPAIKAEDLFVNGVYQKLNRYNATTSSGAMHLIQRNNTLTAEIELAAAATVRRRQAGRELTSAQELILCSRYGAKDRNSDPHIGEQVNALARQRADITLNNPVGLYFDAFNPVNWVTPDGADPRTFWRFVRGEEGHYVRAVIEVPPEKGYMLGDIQIDGRPIEFGAQIVDFVTIKLEGLATRLGQSTVQPVEGCVGGAAIASLSIADKGPSLPGRSITVQEESSAFVEARQLPPGIMVEADVGIAALQPYPQLPASALAPRMVAGRMTAYASPDSTYAVTKRLIDAAQHSVVIGIYDFNADYMKLLLKQAMRRGVSVTLMLDTNSADDPDLFEELARLGANCVKAPSSSSGHPNAYFGNAHEKIIVVDSEIVMIQSGNWSENSCPMNEGDGVIVGQFQPGNRDMGLAIESRELATFFSGLVGRDIRLSEGEPPGGVGAAAVLASSEFFEAAPRKRPNLVASLTVTPSQPVRITPAITPENFHPLLLQSLRAAQSSIRIEQQYIRGHQAAVTQLLDAIAGARQDNSDLDIRIIVSPKYLYGEDKQRFLDAMASFDLEFDEHFRFLSSRHFVHCHNKLIVIDDENIMLGSQNWSTSGLLSNREASLLVEHAGIAGYFGRIFDRDWELSASAEVSAAELELDTSALRSPSDFSGGGVVRSSTKDYRDV